MKSIFIVWADRGEWSDKQTRVLCCTSSKAKAERVVKTAKAIDAKRSKRERWYENWTYAVNQAASADDAIAELNNDYASDAKNANCITCGQYGIDEIIKCNECGHETCNKCTAGKGVECFQCGINERGDDE